MRVLALLLLLSAPALADDASARVAAVLPYGLGAESNQPLEMPPPAAQCSMPAVPSNYLELLGKLSEPVSASPIGVLPADLPRSEPKRGITVIYGQGEKKERGISSEQGVKVYRGPNN